MSSYNAAAELVSKNTLNGLAKKIAYIDDVSSYSFNDLEKECRGLPRLSKKLDYRESSEYFYVCWIASSCRLHFSDVYTKA